MARPALHPITKPSDWAVMMGPVRFELLEAMRVLAPCSVREIALAIDRPADTLYPHLRALLRIGVVTESGSRPGRTRPERIYDLVADDFRPAFRRAGPKVTARAVDRAMQTMAAVVSRASRKAAESGRIQFGAEGQNIVGKLENAWLTPAEFAHVRTRLKSLKRYLDARKARRQGSLYVAAFFLLPATRSRGARTGATRGSSRSSHATRGARSRQADS